MTKEFKLGFGSKNLQTFSGLQYLQLKTGRILLNYFLSCTFCFTTKHVLLVLFVCSMMVLQGSAQRNVSLESMDSVAMVFAARGQFDSALMVMNKRRAFKGFSESNVHHIACYFARMGAKDSAIHYLFYLMDSFPNRPHLYDPDFYSLIDLPAWTVLENRNFNHPQVKFAVKDTAYARILLRMRIKDQAYYDEINIEENLPKPDKEKIKKLWTRKRALHVENLSTLEHLLQTKGWPGFSKVGVGLSSTAFLVIQHSDSATMRKYYHYVKTACDQGEGDCAAQAYLFDRIKTMEGKPQRYGSQARFLEKEKRYALYPLEDTLHVNEFREYMGMGPLEDYLKNWNIELKIPTVRDPLAYADSVVFYQDSRKDPRYPFPHGGRIEDLVKITDKEGRMTELDPRLITRKNTQYALVMPIGSILILKFVDNQLVNYPYQPDIFVKEEGASGDKAVVWVSHDGLQFDSLGITVGGRTSALDLEAIGYALPVKYIKLVSLNNNGSLPGFDLVHVKGTPMSSVPAFYTPTQIDKYLQRARKEDIIALPTVEKKLVEWKDILFDSGECLLSSSAQEMLHTLAAIMKEHSRYKVELNGHTDDTGSEKLNRDLSLKRAKAVADYLMSQGIDKERISTNGYAYEKPVVENNSDRSRARNRRVGIRLYE